MNALVFTATSIGRIHMFGITDDWFIDYRLPPGSHGLKMVEVGDIAYIVEEDLDDDEVSIVVISLTGANAVFKSGTFNSQFLDRIIVASSVHFYNDVRVPPTWRPFSEGDVLSFYASSFHKGKERLHAVRNLEHRDLFFFALTDQTVDFSELDIGKEIYDRARSNLVEAILSTPKEESENDAAGIILCERLPQGFVQGANLEQWYSTKLTAEQRRFVDSDYDGPVRLRGAAGTGKTVSLVVKLLRDARKFAAAGEETKLCFIAHSEGAVDLVGALSETLVTPAEFKGFGSSSCKVEIRTLYDIANENLMFELRDLTPISLDGAEGRELQFELILATLEDAWKSRIIRARFGNISKEILARWTQAVEERERSFVAELMNEFASVLDAENIRRGEDNAASYISRGRRPKWLLDLPKQVDRRFVLEIHGMYRQLLAEMDALSIDEMIADFNFFLDSNSWDRERDRDGYDAVFVDELHFFTALEKQTLHKLLKRDYDTDGVVRRPNIFMAYDLKQSTKDSFVDYFSADASVFSARSRLQNSEVVQLNQVFRYTPQIAEFLRDLDASFPAIDVPGEWNAYVGEAQLPNDDKPKLMRFGTDRELLEYVFDRARATARTIEGGGRRVAVLCVSESAFRRYQPPVRGRYQGSTYLIDSREATVEMRHVRKKFIFSMPEYVAGLQFATVFLIHVNQEEAPQNSGVGRRRQLVSSVYLGASRAEKTLWVACCEERGGPSDVLGMAIDRGSLVEVAP